VANLFLRHYGITAPPPGGGRRIYISRADAAIRRVTNEAEIAELLRGHGFEVVTPGRLSFPAQAAAFHSADIVVSPHGAGLANLMFCRPNTRVLEIFASNFIDEGFLKLAKAVELHYDYFVAGSGDYFQDFAVDRWKFAEKLSDARILRETGSNLD